MSTQPQVAAVSHILGGAAIILHSAQWITLPGKEISHEGEDQEGPVMRGVLLVSRPVQVRVPGEANQRRAVRVVITTMMEATAMDGRWLGASAVAMHGQQGSRVYSWINIKHQDTAT
eukprot:scpid15591/ scgid5940/ 